jgi:hypothetical protein
LSDKDKVSLGEMVFRSIANEKELNLKSFNGINIAYYHHVIKMKETSKVIEIIPPIRKYESILKEDLTSFHLLHQLIRSILEKNPGTTLKFTLKDSKPTLIGQLMERLIRVHDHNRSLDFWKSEYLSDLLQVRSLTLFNF